MKKIGIVSGIGPLAGSFLLYKIFEIAILKKNAKKDNEFPEVVLHSIPMDDFDENGIVKNESVLKQLNNSIDILIKAKVDFIGIACNTVHAFHNELSNSCPVPILNIIDIVSKKVIERNFKSVGVLSSETTKSLGLYNNKFASLGVKVFATKDNEQSVINKVILNIMSGEQLKTDKTKIKKISNRMISEGADAIILGCTELPLLVRNIDSDITYLSSTEVLAEEIINMAY